MLDIRAKASVVLLFCVAAFALPAHLQLAMLPLTVTLPFFSKSFAFNSLRARKAYKRFLAYAIALGTLLVLVNGILIHDGTPLTVFFGIPLFQSGLAFGIRVAARLLLLSFSLLIFFLSTKIRSIADELLKLRIPLEVILPVLLALHFLNRLPVRIEQIFAAQEARGAPVRAHFIKRLRVFFSILTPLILSSISESIERGVALELRGFSSTTRLLSPEQAQTTRRNAATLFFLFLSISLLIWRMLQWLLR
jgi:energy-coupling factor transport system permease protein